MPTASARAGTGLPHHEMAAANSSRVMVSGTLWLTEEPGYSVTVARTAAPIAHALRAIVPPFLLALRASLWRVTVFGTRRRTTRLTVTAARSACLTVPVALDISHSRRTPGRAVPSTAATACGSPPMMSISTAMADLGTTALLASAKLVIVLPLRAGRHVSPLLYDGVWDASNDILLECDGGACTSSCRASGFVTQERCMCLRHDCYGVGDEPECTVNCFNDGNAPKCSARCHNSGDALYVIISCV